MSDIPSQIRTGADALIGALAEAGVSHCFANPGTSELDLGLALDRNPSLRAVSVVFEGVASGAADGFGRIAERPAATLLHLGPGYLNAAANLHNARRARTPLVNIVGDHAVSHRALDAPLASDLQTIVAPHSAWVRDVTTADDMAAAGTEAVAQAMALRGQSTLLVAADAAWASAHASIPAKPPSAIANVAADSIDRAAQAIRAARNPVIFIGGRALFGAGLEAASRLAGAGIRVIAETFPARWRRGSGVFAPERLIYFAEMGLAQLGAADLLLLAGAREPVSYFAYPDKPATAVPPGCRLLALTQGAQDEAAALSALAEALGARAPANAAAALDIAKPAGALTAAALGASIGRHLPENALFSDDGVTASLPTFQATSMRAPHDWMCLTGGALGQGAPLAFGAALAAPDRKTVCLTGDGALLYTVQALWSIAREKANVAIVVAVNRSYEILRIELARMGAVNAGAEARALLDLSNPAISYAQIANGLGVEAVRCDTAEGFDDAFAAAAQRNSPMLIEAILAQ